MSVKKLTLTCLVWPDDVHGEKTTEVELDNNNAVDFLKEIIKDKYRRLANVYANELVLWKCSGLPDDDNLEQTLNTLQFDGSDNRLVHLTPPRRQISHFFEDQDLSKEPIHILVEVPTLGEYEYPPRKRLRIETFFPDLPPNTVERSDTVSAIYQKLLLYRFILVRGTPASGKSTLAMLLGRHIRAQEPNVHVIWVGCWRLDVVAECGGWHSYLKKRKGWIPGEDTVFIFDPAQSTYKDGELWHELFKSIHDYPDRRAIAFATYGSPSSFIDIQGTLIFVPPAARVSLLPTVYQDNLPAAGLLFTPAEFNELVSKEYPDSKCHFDRSFLNMVFEMTEGHVGAMYSFLHIILGSERYRQLKGSGERYTWEEYQQTVSQIWFLRQLENAGGGIFRRGLPSDGKLKVPAVAHVFSSVLRNGSVLDTDFTSEDNKNALHLCFTRGWLHTDYIDDEINYFFPSSLHRWYIEWKLSGILDMQTVS